ncbi:MAG: hypothetical protein QOK47_209, partial [Actinomycetota bacterium]|nr:hypothetical protein [Actinomycetota bacterium]
MSRLRIASTHVAAALTGAIFGAVLVLAVDGMTRSPAPDPARPQAQENLEILPDLHPSNARVLLAWSPLGLPA